MDEMDYILAKVDALKSSANAGAGVLPIPSKLDRETSSVVQRFMSASLPNREEIASLFTKEHTDVLLGFAERMASLAVRQGNMQPIQEGLAAVVLDRGKLDMRENILVLAPLYDSAARLGLDCREIFHQAASLLPGDLSSIVEEFPNRSHERKNLAAMGYEVGSDDDGFLYRRTW